MVFIATEIREEESRVRVRVRAEPGGDLNPGDLGMTRPGAFSSEAKKDWANWEIFFSQAGSGGDRP